MENDESDYFNDYSLEPPKKRFELRKQLNRLEFVFREFFCIRQGRFSNEPEIADTFHRMERTELCNGASQNVHYQSTLMSFTG